MATKLGMAYQPRYIGRESKNPVEALLGQKISDIMIGFLYLFLLMENPLSSIWPILEYYDEFIFATTLIMTLVNACNPSCMHEKFQAKTAVLLIIITLVGLAGNAASQYQASNEAIVKDVVAFLKFPVTFLCVNYLLGQRKSVNDSLAPMLSLISKLFITICFVFAVVNLMNPTELLSHDLRNGIWSYKFVFTHPTFLVFSLVMCYVSVSLTDTKMDAYKVMCLLSLVLTMRDKAFGFVGLAVVAWIIGLRNRKHMLPIILFAGIVVLFVAWPKISEYLSYPNSPRQALYSSALMMATKLFPFGGGFASIACTLSAEYYSNAYIQFGISGMEGLSPIAYGNAGDAGFAYYLGEFGFIGLLIFLSILVLCFKMSMRRAEQGSTTRVGVFLTFGYIVIALTVETVLTNATGVSIAILLAIIANERVSSKNSDYLLSCLKYI